MRLLLFGLIFFSKFCFSQFLQNGLILPAKKENKDELCCILSPQEGFTIYDNPNGNVIGILTRSVKQNSGDQTPYRIFFVDIKNKSEKEIELSNFQEIGYEVWALKYFERKNGFLRIINKSNNYWLNESEIIKKKFSITEWQDFLINNSDIFFNFYANEPGLDLLDKPSNEGKILKKLGGVLDEIHLTKEKNGKWSKVNVIKRKEEPCISDLDDEENIEYKIEGWIKIVNENGLPNVWFFTRGC